MLVVLRQLKKKWLMGIFVATIVLVSVTPRVGVTPTVGNKDTYRFYVVSHGGPADPFWATVMRGVDDCARKYGVEAVYLGPAKFSIKEMVDMLESAIAAKPDGIAITISNPTPLDEPLRRAIKQGIPVIAINVPDTRSEEERIPYLCYVGADLYLDGVEVAQRVLKEFTPKRVLIGISEPGNVALEMRAKGFRDVMKEKSVPVEKLDITVDPIKAIGAFESYFARHPETDAIFVASFLGTQPALKFLEERGLVGKVKLASCDLSPMIVSAIKEGTMICTVDQQQYLQGYLPIEFLYFYNKYGFCPCKDVLTGPMIIDAGNIEIVEKTVEEGHR